MDFQEHTQTAPDRYNDAPRSGNQVQMAPADTGQEKLEELKGKQATAWASR